MLGEQADADVARVIKGDFGRHDRHIDPGETVRPLVDGERTGGADEETPLIDPSTGEAFASIAYATVADLERAVESSARSLALWRSVPFADRGRKLRRLAELIREDAWPLAHLVAQEQGKPVLEAFQLEILPALDHLRFITGYAERYNAGLQVDPRHPFYAHKQAQYLYDAVGVIALVTASTLPFASPLIQVAAALAMGNAIVLKPSEKTPLCGLRIGELCREAGFPAGLVNVVPARAEDTPGLVAHDKVDKVFITGSVDAGRHVMVAAGCALRPVVLSLGGKHPTVVAGDADVNRAARGVAWGALANAGQNCGSIERVYVEERIASEFIDRLLEEVDKVRVGSAMADDVDMGPLLTEEHRQAVHAQVTEAVKGGAKLLRGGKLATGPGFFYPPTVLMGPPHGCKLMKEETLGPVIPIVLVDSIERGMLLAGDGEYALTASGWTRDPEQAQRLMTGLPAGVVTINDVLYSYGEPAATWSGYRLSGSGQNHGTPGLREMSRQRFASFDASKLEAPLFSYPYDLPARAVAETALEHLHGRSRFRRLMAGLRLATRKRFRTRAFVRWLLLNPRRGGR